MKKVIVNADDFGLSRGINEGIVQAHKEGILTSATLLANMPGFEQAVDLAKQNKNMGTGVHLNIVRGHPVSKASKVRSLLDGENKFFARIPLILRKALTGKIDLREVELEYRAQIEKILASGLKVSHFDSEKHTHVFSPFFKIAVKLAKDYNIKKIRFINEMCFSFRVAQMAKAFFASLSCKTMKKSIQEEGILITDKFYGICQSGEISASWLKRVLWRLKNGVTEIMVHPGFLTPDVLELKNEFGPYYINKSREAELEALQDGEVKEIIASQKIQLITFHEF